MPQVLFWSSKYSVRSVGELEEGFGGKNMSVLGENTQTPDAHYDDHDDDDDQLIMICQQLYVLKDDIQGLDALCSKQSVREMWLPAKADSV